MRFVSFFLVSLIVLLQVTLVNGQTPVTQKAKLLVSEGNRIEGRDVELSLDADSLNITPIKPSGDDRSIDFSSIKSIEYSYSDKPRYTAGTAGVLAIGIVAAPLFFNKTKKNWLVVNAGGAPTTLQLLGKNYRMLLLEMQRKGINILDAGDRDKKK